MTRSAILSEDEIYRYVLQRSWEENARSLMIIGLNPSTADAIHDDPTIRKCIKFAKSWGYGSLFVLNLFAYRATDPKDLLKSKHPIGPENDQHLKKMAEKVDQIVCAWGNWGSYEDRAKRVLRFLPKTTAIKINKTGHPSHPLYLPDNSELVAYGI